MLCMLIFCLLTRILTDCSSVMLDGGSVPSVAVDERAVRPVFVQPVFVQLFSSNPFRPILLG